MKKYSFLFFVFACLNVSYAQISSCPYSFNKNLEMGVSDKDVYVIQKILNSDRRTVVATSGPGSMNRETNYFGKATKEALKRFQALFIEITQEANGEFNDNTRKVMQAVCDQGGNIQNAEKTLEVNNEVTEIKEDIKVSLKTNTLKVNSGETIRVNIYLSSPITKLTPEQVIIDGGVVKELRKIKSTEYLLLITPNEDARVVSIQIEAEKIEGSNGSTNELASNEIEVNVEKKADALILDQGTNPLEDLLNGVSNQGVTVPAVTTAPSSVYSPTYSPTAMPVTTPSPSPFGLGSFGALGGLIGSFGKGMFGNDKGGDSVLGKSPSGYTPDVTPPPSSLTPPRSETPSGEVPTSKPSVGKCDANITDTHDNIKKELKAKGINVSPGVSSFEGSPKDTALFLSMLEYDCGCKITVTSAVRKGRAERTAHGPKSRSFDIGYSAEFGKFVKSKGKVITKCWYLYKGIKFYDEGGTSIGACQSAGWDGPHWHVEGINWDCT